MSGDAQKMVGVAAGAATFPVTGSFLSEFAFGRLLLAAFGVTAEIQANIDGVPSGGLASNVATAPKLAAQLLKENLANIASQDARLALAVSGRGNFSIGTGTAAESDALGKIWVGDGAKSMSGVPERFGFWVNASIGSDESDGSDDFQIFMCNQAWLDDRSMAGLVGANKYLLIDGHCDSDGLVESLKSYLTQCAGNDWAEVVAKISRIGIWEFEGYQP